MQSKSVVFNIAFKTINLMLNHNNDLGFSLQKKCYTFKIQITLIRVCTMALPLRTIGSTNHTLPSCSNLDILSKGSAFRLKCTYTVVAMQKNYGMVLQVGESLQMLHDDYNIR